MPSDLPAEVRAFISEHIDSIEQLEVLLLLRRERGRDWTAAEASDELRTNVRSTAERLDDLARRRLIVNSSGAVGAPPRYRYGPRSADAERAAGGLADAYARQRVSVISTIFSKPIDKLRSFADAFRLRQEDEDG